MRHSAAIALIPIAALLLASCAQPGTPPPARVTMEIVVRAGRGCGPEGAKNLTARAAAYKTLKRGYSGYLLLLQAARDEIVVISREPQPADPLEPGATEEHSVILMMRRDDPDYGKATEARAVLGPRWSSILASELPTSCGKP